MILSTVDGNHLNRELKNVNANYWCNALRAACEKQKAQMIVRSIFIHRRRRFRTPFAHRLAQGGKAHRKAVERESINNLDAGQEWAHLRNGGRWLAKSREELKPCRN
jgi:hypothetical protein